MASQPNGRQNGPPINQSGAQAMPQSSRMPLPPFAVPQSSTSNPQYPQPPSAPSMPVLLPQILQQGHSNAEISDARRQMFDEIRRVLEQIPGRTNTQDWLTKLPQMAQKLEETLFQEAKSIADYMSKETLRNRLHSLVSRLQKNRQSTSNVPPASSIQQPVPKTGVQQQHLMLPTSLSDPTQTQIGTFSQATQSHQSFQRQQQTPEGQTSGLKAPTPPQLQNAQQRPSSRPNPPSQPQQQQQQQAVLQSTAGLSYPFQLPYALPSFGQQTTQSTSQQAAATMSLPQYASFAASQPNLQSSTMGFTMPSSLTNFPITSLHSSSIPTSSNISSTSALTSSRAMSMDQTHSVQTNPTPSSAPLNLPSKLNAAFSMAPKLETATAQPPTMPSSNTQFSPQDRQTMLCQQQQRLLLLRHASKCPSASGECPVTKLCDTTKVLWRHLQACREKHCSYPHCMSSRTLLSHFHGCRDSTCGICAPVRSAIQLSEEKKQSRGRAPRQATSKTKRTPETSAPQQAAMQPPSKRVKVEERKPSPATSAPIQPPRLLNPPFHSGPSTDEKPVTIPPPQRPNLEGNRIPEDSAHLLDLLSVDELREHLDSLDKTSDSVRDQLKVMCMPLHQQIWNHQFGHIFHKRVDAIRLGLPDYYDIVKRPMDLTTIKKRLDGNQYRGVSEFDDDIVLMLENAILFNGEGSDIAEVSREMLSSFRVSMDKVYADIQKKIEEQRAQPNACPLCCQEKLLFDPVTYFCTNPNCGERLRHNVEHYGYRDSRWCVPCYQEMKRGEPQHLESGIVYKQDLQHFNYNEEDEEPWVECDGCQRWVHQICALFNSRVNTSEGAAYLCPRCVLNRLDNGGSVTHSKPAGEQQESTGYLGSERLAPCALSDYIEERVNKHLETRYVQLHQPAPPAQPEPAQAEQFEEVDPASDHNEALSAELGSELDILEAEVDSGKRGRRVRAAKKRPPTDEEEEEGDDIDEQGQGPLPPPTRTYTGPIPPEDIPKVTVRVVASSDKIHTPPKKMLARYRPIQPNYPDGFPCRSKCLVVTQKTHGVDIMIFVMFIYEYGPDAPPPNTNRVFISYLDSVNYFNPSTLRTELYHEILISYLDYCRNRGFVSAHLWACPPLKGDDYILFCHPPEQKIPREERLCEWYKSMFIKAQRRGIVDRITNLHDEYLARGSTNPTELPFFDGDYWVGEIGSMIDTVQQEFGAGELVRKKSATGRSTRGGTNDPVMTRLAKTLEPMKESFMIAYFAPVQPFALLPLDPDPLIENEIAETRQSFLNYCQANHYQFDQLRRAKHSTLMLCHALHSPSDKLGEQDAERKKSAREHLGLLEHVTVCDGNCGSEKCRKLRDLLHHMKACELTRARRPCPVCQRMTLLLQAHARSCSRPKCPTPFCSSIKERLKQRAEQQSQMDNRRRAAMNAA